MRSAQHQVAKTVNKLGRQTLVPDKESHVDRSIERIKKQIHVYVPAQFAATNSATKRGVCFQTPRKQEAFAKSGDQIWVALAAPQDGGNDSSTAAAKDFHQLAHLLAHVGIYRTRIWKVEGASRTVGECVCNQRGFVGPPAVNRRLTDAGMGRYILNG
jgi:hypothetical protein